MKVLATVVKGFAYALTISVLFPTYVWAQVANTIPYKLNPGSTYQTGCFPPCTCPLSREFDLTGTFTLTCAEDFFGAQGLLRNHAVRDVEWRVSLPDSSDPPVPVTGFGTFLRDERIFVDQIMRLKLKIGDAPSRRFVGEGFGTRFPNIRISQFPLTSSLKYVMFCQDTVIVVDASPLGACCPAGPDDPSCLVATEAECLSQGGAYQGMGSTCPTEPGALCGVAEGVDFVCPAEPWQPCCFSSPAPSQPACFISTEQECAGAGGTFLAGASCDPVVCDATPMACCRSAGCTDRILDLCVSGPTAIPPRIALGPGSSCDTADCANIVAGACCSANPASSRPCFVTTPEACSFAGGTYQGDDTTCPIDAEELCGPFTGACCFSNADATESTCAVTTFEACLAGGGIYQGDHTTCDPALCNCCFPDDSCTTMPPGVCSETLAGIARIPAVSAWGVIVMALLLVTAGTVVIRGEKGSGYFKQHRKVA
jgi:hypothetical protein